MKLKFFLVALFVLVFGGISLAEYSHVSALAVIPAGCPGSPLAGPPAIDCSKIPLGCPGTTKQGPVATTPTNCPYAAPSTTTAPTTTKLTDCGTNYKPDPSGTYCVANTIDPATCSLLTTAQQIASHCPNAGIVTDTNSALIDKYLNPLIKLLTVLVGIAVTFGVIYGGIQYSMSAGDPQKAASGRKHVRDSVIALVAYALALSLLNFLIPGGIAHP